MQYRLTPQRKKALGKDRIMALFEAPITETYTAHEVAHQLHADPAIVQTLLDELVTSGDLLTEI